MSSKVSPSVKIFGLVSFLNDIASEMLYPVIPIFLTAVLGAPAAVVGLIEGLAESVVNISKTFFGFISDKLGRRKIFVTLGYSISTLSKPLLALAYVWPLVLVARIFDRLGKGIRTASRDAMIADLTRPEYRGRAFGFHRSMDTLGAVLGPLFALLILFFLPENYRLLFLIAFFPATFSVLLLIFFIKEKKQAEKPTRALMIEAFSLKKMSRDYKLFLFVSIIFALGSSSDAFLILRTKDLGLATALVILVYVLYNIFYALFSYPAGIISDKIGRRKVYISGLLIFALVYLGFAFAKSSLWVWFLWVLYGFYIALTEGISRAYVVDLTPKETRATVLGFYQTLIGFAAFFASLLGGILWDAFGPQATFFYGAGMAILSFLIFIFTTRNMSVNKFNV